MSRYARLYFRSFTLIHVDIYLQFAGPVTAVLGFHDIESRIKAMYADFQSLLDSLPVEMRPTGVLFSYDGYKFV